MSEVIVRPPNPKDKGYLHTDGGQAMRQIRVSDGSLPLQIKIHYFLTDLDALDRGNFTVVPGSHNRPFPEEGVEEVPYLPEVVQLCVKSGDAAMFPHALWHGVVSNKSDKPRKTLIYCYSHQCFRAFDYVKASAGLLERCTPRQRRLIGDIGEWKSGSYFYSPGDQVQLIEGTEPDEVYRRCMYDLSLNPEILFQNALRFLSMYIVFYESTQIPDGRLDNLRIQIWSLNRLFVHPVHNHRDDHAQVR
jgi:hypothetical protein